MAIEDILQVKESVTENPMGDPQTVNQAEFLRFQEQMGLGPGGVIAKLIQMFVEEPSDFTRKFGVEAADSVREFLDLTTQKELENQGRVFAPNSAEIIGQNIDYTPDQSALGTLQTDQAAKAEGMIEFMKKGLPTDQGQIWRENQMTGEVDLLDKGEAEIPKWITKKEDFDPKDYREGYLMLMNNLYPDTDREVHAQEYDNWFRGGEGSEYYEDRKNRLLKLLSNLPDGGAGYESAEDFWKRNYPEQFDKEGKYIGKKEAETQYDVDKLNKYVEEQLNAEPGTYRVLSDEEVEVLGYPTKDGQIYEIDEATNDVRQKEPGLIEGGILKLLDWFKYGKTDRESR